MDTETTPSPPSGGSAGKRDPIAASGPAFAGEALHIEGSAVDRIAALGAQATGVEIVFVDYKDGTRSGIPQRFPVAIVHGESPKVVGLASEAEAWRFQPEHRRGIARVGDVDSFCTLVNRQKTANSVVFANSDWKAPSIEAVIDYHDVAADGAPDYGRHRIRYDFPFSDEWKIWLKYDGVQMGQTDFAEFVEERAPDMTTLGPDEARVFAAELQLNAIGTPVQIFELARGLEINATSKIKQNVKLQSGEGKLIFEEEHSGRDGQPVNVPGAFALSIPLFYNQPPINVPVRLRYRLAAGAIVWTYKLFRIDRMVAEAVDNAKAEIAAETDLAVYEGAPEMSAAGTPVAV